MINIFKVSFFSNYKKRIFLTDLMQNYRIIEDVDKTQIITIDQLFKYNFNIALLLKNSYNLFKMPELFV